jgi:hypothetical protein
MSGQIEVYSGYLGQSMGCTPLLQYSWYTPPSPRLLRDFELVIEKVGSEIVLDYGAKLRLLMADPFKGMDLREAIEQLKEALKTGG